MSSIETPSRPEQPRVTPDEAEERAKRLIALVISTVAIVGALLALVRANASANGDEFKRLSKRLTIETSAMRLGSQVELGFNLTAAQAWLEMAKLTAAAERSGPIKLPNWQNFSYGVRPWPAAVATVVPADWYAPARDRLADVAPLLQEPYSGDVRYFYAERSLTEETRLNEAATDARRRQDGWADKSSSYSFYLAILAIGGAILGLSTTMQDRARLICFVTGVGIAFAVFALSLTAYTRPVSGLSEAAQRAYAEGFSFAYRGALDSREDTAEMNRQAVAAFDRAIELEPGYANAHFERANALYRLGDNEAAVESYRRAIAAGRSDTGTLWNMGWNLYLLGNFEEAVATYRDALEIDPGLVTVRMNLALALLASGQVENAQSEYTTALTNSEQQIARARDGGPQVPYSFWKQIDRSALDLDALLSRLDNGEIEAWMEAPPREKLNPSEDLRASLAGLSGRLREAGNMLEYEGVLPAGNEASYSRARQSSSLVDGFKFSLPGGRGFDTIFVGTPFEAGAAINLSSKSLMPPAPEASNTYTTSFTTSLNDDIIEYNPSVGIEFSSVLVNFEYAGLSDGNEVVWKVYRDGVEDHSLRWRETWRAGSRGHAVKPLDFVFASPGRYRIEMYYDWRLTQAGEFTIRPWSDE